MLMPGQLAVKKANRLGSKARDGPTVQKLIPCSQLAWMAAQLLAVTHARWLSSEPTGTFRHCT